MSSFPSRAGELQHLPDLRLELAEREDPAQPQADEEAPPAAVPLADDEAEAVEPRGRERLADGLALVREHRLRRLREDLLVRGQPPDGVAGCLELRDQVRPLDLDRVADDVTDQAVMDRRDPVAEQVAEPGELGVVDQLLPGVSIPLLDGPCHQLDGLLVGGELRDELRELADVRAAPSLRPAAARPARGRAGRLPCCVASGIRPRIARPACGGRGALTSIPRPRRGMRRLWRGRPPRRRRASPSPGRLRAPRSEALYRVSDLPCVSFDFAVDDGERRGRTSGGPARAGLAIEGVACTPRRAPADHLPASLLCAGTKPPRPPQTLPSL